MHSYYTGFAGNLMECNKGGNRENRHNKQNKLKIQIQRGIMKMKRRKNERIVRLRLLSEYCKYFCLSIDFSNGFL